MENLKQDKKNIKRRKYVAEHHDLILNIMRKSFAKNKGKYNQQKREQNKIFHDKWYSGVVCSECGSQSDINYHHIDPKEKDFDSEIGRRKTDEEVRAELMKCIPLCRSCHASLHKKLYWKNWRESKRLQ